MSTRTFILHSALDDQLLFRQLSGHEALSQVARFDIHMTSTSANIDANDLLGTHMTVEVVTQTGGSRYLDGIVTGFAYVGPEDSSATRYLYTARVHSWLELATRTSDCRIHQQKDAPTIIKDTLSPLGMPFEFELNGNYAPHDYVVQYNETALMFAMRIAEEAGIYWYVKHELGSHTVVFVDGSHDPITDYDSIVFLTPGQRPMEADEYIEDLYFSNELKSGTYITRSYNFKHPTANLEQSQSVPKGHSNDGLEMFEWTGNYMERDQGAALANVHREQQQLDYGTISGSTNVRGMAPGYTFALEQHPRSAANTEYLVLSSTYTFQENAEGSSTGHTSWSIAFTVRESKERYYPPRVTKRPTVTGPHSALVTGPAGQEIWCDEYGSIKLHFYWDRYSKMDENSSKWIRVSSTWAGSNFGGVNVPRIGQEVLVDYLNGDISSPIVVGRVYNRWQMPPWTLPANATQSGLLSRSSPGGQYGNANALRFEDKKGQEHVWLQAEKDMQTVVENNDTQTVGANRVIGVGGTHNETVKKAISVTSTDETYTLNTKTGVLIQSESKTITITVGKSSISMDDAGNIAIRGVNITIDGETSVVIKTQTMNAIASDENLIKGNPVQINP